MKYANGYPTIMHRKVTTNPMRRECPKIPKYRKGLQSGLANWDAQELKNNL